MNIGAVIEVCRLPNGELPSQLLAAAYVASRTAPVVFVRDRRDSAALDRALDRVVEAHSLAVHGVVYLDSEDDQRIGEALARTEIVVAASERFRSRLPAVGAAALSPDEALSKLAALEPAPRRATR